MTGDLNSRIGEARDCSDMNDAERTRLADPAVEAMGTVRVGAVMGHRPRGLQRGWRRVGFLPHDHARSRAYRWNEDGLAGICDDAQTLCLAFAFWNGRDPILKERIFGLTGPQGNHGEDAKEYWFYEDCTPTHSWMRWRYFYPQTEFPYAQLVDENGRRGFDDPEFELLDTGIFDDDRYWDITVDYAKADTDDIVARVTIRNAGPDAATICTCYRRCGSATRGRGVSTIARPEHRRRRHRRWSPAITHSADATVAATVRHSSSSATTSRTRDGCGMSTGAAFPKDAINDHVVGGTTRSTPHRSGTKAALWYRARGRRRRDRRRSSSGCTATVSLRARRPTTCSPSRSARPTSSTPR